MTNEPVRFSSRNENFELEGRIGAIPQRFAWSKKSGRRMTSSARLLSICL